MDPLSIGLLTGGANLLGSLFSSSTSASNTQAQIAAQEQMQGQTEQFNAQQAQMNRDFQQQMSSTAYQRASTDMTAAGLNPAMMFGSGSAESTPGGSTASVSTPTVPTSQKTSPLAGLGDSVKAGFTTALQSKEMDVLTQKAAELDIANQMNKAKLDIGSPQADVALTRSLGKESDSRSNLNRQTGDIRLPEQYAGQLFGDLPDWAKTAISGTKMGTGMLKDIFGMLPKANININSASKASASDVASRIRGEINQPDFSGRFNRAYGDE